jgi:lysozyme
MPTPLAVPAAPPGMTLGIDASADQGTLDVAVLQAVGVSFAWLKATDGLHDVDAQFHPSAAACVARGLPFGCYGVLEAYGAALAAAQAAHFADTIAGCGAALAPWLDFEVRGKPGARPPAADVLASAVAWCDAVEQRIGRRVIVYTFPAFIASLAQEGGSAVVASLAALAMRPLAIAHYDVASPTVPGLWKDWTVWQRSGNGAAKLPWAPYLDVDVDVTRLSVADLAAL